MEKNMETGIICGLQGHRDLVSRLLRGSFGNYLAPRGYAYSDYVPVTLKVRLEP